MHERSSRDVKASGSLLTAISSIRFGRLWDSEIVYSLSMSSEAESPASRTSATVPVPSAIKPATESSVVRKKLPPRKRLKRQLRRAQDEAVQVIVERDRLKYFLILMVTTWPIGLFWGWSWALYIAVGWACFWVVGRYLNFFHRRNANIRLAIAQQDVAAFHEANPQEPRIDVESSLTPEQNEEKQ